MLFLTAPFLAKGKLHDKPGKQEGRHRDDERGLVGLKKSGNLPAQRGECPAGKYPFEVHDGVAAIEHKPNGSGKRCGEDDEYPSVCQREKACTDCQHDDDDRGQSIIYRHAHKRQNHDGKADAKRCAREEDAEVIDKIGKPAKKQPDNERNDDGGSLG